jgi:hypothetical protein
MRILRWRTERDIARRAAEGLGAYGNGWSTLWSGFAGWEWPAQRHLGRRPARQPCRAYAGRSPSHSTVILTHDNHRREDGRHAFASGACRRLPGGRPPGRSFSYRRSVMGREGAGRSMWSARQPASDTPAQSLSTRGLTEERADGRPWEDEGARLGRDAPTYLPIICSVCRASSKPLGPFPFPLACQACSVPLEHWMYPA